MATILPSTDEANNSIRNLIKPFDLTNGPLIRFSLLSIKTYKYNLIFLYKI
jgi:hypothetical protein